MAHKVKTGNAFVTSVLDFKTFKNFSHTFAWETEVWIDEQHEHMIHLTGDRL